MGRIDEQIKTYELMGFTVDRINNRSGIFSYKDKIKFKGSYSLFGFYLKTEFITGAEIYEQFQNRLVFLYKLKSEGLISDKSFIAVGTNIESIYLKKHDKYLDLLSEARVKLKNKNKRFSFKKIKYLLVILPKATRKEFIADLECLISDMKEDDCSNFYIFFVVTLHITSVAYHAFFFKLKDYFYSDKNKPDDD